MLRNKKPLVSIILASYNHADFVTAAIKSVLNQRIDSLEVIIIDDGSDDSSVAKIKKIKDQRIKLVSLERGRAQNPRNLGLKLARGKYIAFQNSDDIWEPNKLVLQLTEFKRNKNLAVCFTGVSFIDKQGLPSDGNWLKNSFTTGNRPRTDWLRYMFEYGNCFCISSALIKRNSLKLAGNFNESLFQLSDLDMWMRLAGIGDFYIVAKPLTKMRVIKNRNVSYPSDDVIRRSAIEFAQVLTRYSEPPIIKDLDKAFAEIMPEHGFETTIKLAILAKYAWNKSPSHRLFADNLFAKLLNNPGGRQLIAGTFGAELINEFIKRRGQMEIFINE